MSTEQSVVSDDNQAVSDGVENPENTEETQADSVSDADAEKIRANHRKLLGQNKRTKEELARAQSQLIKLEESQMESEGKKDELISSQRERIKSLEEALSEKDSKFAYKSINAQISQEALKLGCIDTDGLMRLADLSTLQADGDTFEADPEDVKLVLEDVKKKRPYLFKKDATPIADGTPAKPALDNYVDELKNAKTQREFDAVRKKYGRV